MQTHTLSDGRTMGVKLHGSGSPVVLLVGLGMPPAVWHYCGIVRDLAERGFTVIIPIYQGLPPSSSRNKYMTIGDLATDIRQILHLTDTSGPLVLVGTSLGTFVAIEFANRHPQLLSAAVLISGPAPSPLVPAIDAMELEHIEVAGSGHGWPLTHSREVTAHIQNFPDKQLRGGREVADPFASGSTS